MLGNLQIERFEHLRKLLEINALFPLGAFSLDAAPPLEELLRVHTYARQARTNARTCVTTLTAQGIDPQL